MHRLGPTAALAAATLGLDLKHKAITGETLVQVERVLVVLAVVAVPKVMVLLVPYQATAAMVCQTALQETQLFVLLAAVGDRSMALLVLAVPASAVMALAITRQPQTAQRTQVAVVEAVDTQAPVLAATAVQAVPA